uniref:G protein-coupled receptor n=1 Tax=Haemonchus contortus TaxID=6289 RepID=A0A7I4Y7U8_HAECO
HIYKSTAIFLIYFTPILVNSTDMLPDQTEARMWAEKEFTCARSAFSVPNLQIFIPSELRRIVFTIVFVCCMAFIISVGSVIASYKFLRDNSSMSQKTKQMQKRFLRSLIIQVSIPLVSMLLPIASLMFMLGTMNGTGRGIGNFIMAVFGSHGSLAAIMLILCNAPYRKFVTSPITHHCKDAMIATTQGQNREMGQTTKIDRCIFDGTDRNVHRQAHIKAFLRNLSDSICHQPI